MISHVYKLFYEIVDEEQEIIEFLRMIEII